MLSASNASITELIFTPQNPLSFFLRLSFIDLSLLHTSKSGWIPIDLNSFTECCVGLVFISTEVLI